MKNKIAEYAKFIAALAGAFLTAFAGLLPAEVTPWAQACIAFLAAAAVVLVPNRAPEGGVQP